MMSGVFLMQNMQRAALSAVQLSALVRSAECSQRPVVERNLNPLRQSFQPVVERNFSHATNYDANKPLPQPHNRKLERRCRHRTIGRNRNEPVPVSRHRKPQVTRTTTRQIQALTHIRAHRAHTQRIRSQR